MVANEAELIKCRSSFLGNAISFTLVTAVNDFVEERVKTIAFNRNASSPSPMKFLYHRGAES